jgi:hypothetical protein
MGMSEVLRLWVLCDWIWVKEEGLRGDGEMLVTRLLQCGL